MPVLPSAAADRVVVVGAGVGGLAAGIAAASRGLAVTLVERAAAPGGKMREVPVGDALLDGGPTVFTMKWVFDELFAEAGTSLERQIALRRAEILGRHAWTDGSRLDLFADAARTGAAIGDFAGAAEARPLRGLPPRCEAHLRDAEGQLHDRSASQPFGVDPPRRHSEPDRDQTLLQSLDGTRQLFRRSAPAPAFRPLCHLLRQLSLRCAGNADACGACRTGWSVAGGRWNASAGQSDERPGCPVRRRAALRERRPPRFWSTAVVSAASDWRTARCFRPGP